MYTAVLRQAGSDLQATLKQKQETQVHFARLCLNFINQGEAWTPRLGNSPKKCPPHNTDSDLRGKPGRAARCQDLLLQQTQTCWEQISWHPSTKASYPACEAARAALAGAAATDRQPCTLGWRGAL